MDEQPLSWKIGNILSFPLHGKSPNEENWVQSGVNYYLNPSNEHQQIVERDKAFQRIEQNVPNRRVQQQMKDEYDAAIGVSISGKTSPKEVVQSEKLINPDYQPSSEVLDVPNKQRVNYYTLDDMIQVRQDALDQLVGYRQQLNDMGLNNQLSLNKDATKQAILTNDNLVSGQSSLIGKQAEEQRATNQIQNQHESNMNDKALAQRKYEADLRSNDTRLGYITNDVLSRRNTNTARLDSIIRSNYLEQQNLNQQLARIADLASLR